MILEICISTEVNKEATALQNALTDHHNQITVLFCVYTLAKVQHLPKIVFNIPSMSGDETRACCAD